MPSNTHIHSFVNLHRLLGGGEMALYRPEVPNMIIVEAVAFTDTFSGGQESVSLHGCTGDLIDYAD